MLLNTDDGIYSDDCNFVRATCKWDLDTFVIQPFLTRIYVTCKIVMSTVVADHYVVVLTLQIPPSSAVAQSKQASRICSKSGGVTIAGPHV